MPAYVGVTLLPLSRHSGVVPPPVTGDGTGRAPRRRGPAPVRGGGKRSPRRAPASDRQTSRAAGRGAGRDGPNHAAAAFGGAPAGALRESSPPGACTGKPAARALRARGPSSVHKTAPSSRARAMYAGGAMSTTRGRSDRGCCGMGRSKSGAWISSSAVIHASIFALAMAPADHRRPRRAGWRRRRRPRPPRRSGVQFTASLRRTGDGVDRRQAHGHLPEPWQPCAEDGSETQPNASGADL